ncbi:MAG TPA: alginate lyase family protein [Nocardioides sp.]|nr:alginate lyase family protein [Nocardioides sp.]
MITASLLTITGGPAGPPPAQAAQPPCPGSPGNEVRTEDPAMFGDWDGDGIDGPAVRRGNTFLLRNSSSLGSWDVALSWGRPTDVPLVGDWDGDGIDTIGLKRDNTYFLRATNDPANGLHQILTWGAASDIPVVGNWNGTVDPITGETLGDDTIGTKSKDGNTYRLAADNSPTPAVYKTFSWGQANDDPVAGDWDGDGDDTIGLKRGSSWFLAHTNETTPGQWQTFTWGRPCGTALAAVPTVNGPATVAEYQDRRVAGSGATFQTFPRSWWIRGHQNFIYPRPVVLIDDATITRAQERLASGDPAYAESYLQTKRSAAYGEPHQGTTTPPAVPPAYTLTTPYTSQNNYLSQGNYFDVARQASMRARDSALVYRVEGLTGYRDNAKSMLAAWASATPAQIEQFACTISGTSQCSGAGMRVGRTILGFATAYSLLYDEFTVAERDKIDRWLLGLADHIETSRQDFMCWPQPAPGQPCNGYHYGERWQNHVTAMTMGRLAIGLALDDSRMIDDVLRDSYGTFPDDVRAVMNGVLLPACGGTGQLECEDVLYEGDPTLTLSKPRAWLGEIYDRYRSWTVVAPDGNTAGSHRGLTYSEMQLGMLTMMAQMAHASRHDDTLFTRTTPRGVTLGDAFEFYAPFWSYSAACGGAIPPAHFTQRSGYYASEDSSAFPLCTQNNGSGYWEFAYRLFETSASKAVLCTVRGRVTYEYEALGWASPLLYGRDVTC